jgi:hypothetical protein
MRADPLDNAASLPAAPAGTRAGAGARALPWTGTEPSHSYPPEVVGQIHEMAEVGRYEIRGGAPSAACPRSTT